jgi:hypothetical protein
MRCRLTIQGNRRATSDVRQIEVTYRRVRVDRRVRPRMLWTRDAARTEREMSVAAHS